MFFKKNKQKELPIEIGKFNYNFVLKISTRKEIFSYHGQSSHKTAFTIEAYKNIWKWFHLRESRYYLLDWRFKDSVSHVTFDRTTINFIRLNIDPIKSKPPVDP